MFAKLTAENVLNINPFHATDLFWYPLKTSENLWFSYVFRGYQKRSVAWNVLIFFQNQIDASLNFLKFLREIIVFVLSWVLDNCSVLKFQIKHDVYQTMQGMYFKMSWMSSVVGSLVTAVSSPPEVFLGKSVLKICSKFTEEHPSRSAVSINMLCNFIEITIQHGCIFSEYLFQRTPLEDCFWTSYLPEQCKWCIILVLLPELCLSIILQSLTWLQHRKHKPYLNKN